MLCGRMSRELKSAVDKVSAGMSHPTAIKLFSDFLTVSPSNCSFSLNALARVKCESSNEVLSKVLC